MATFPFFFFFSSRRRHTRLTCDWSSDVCSSDLIALSPFREAGYRRLMDAHVVAGNRAEALRVYEQCRQLLAERSEERRVGKSVELGGCRMIEKKKRKRCRETRRFSCHDQTRLHY